MRIDNALLQVFGSDVEEEVYLKTWVSEIRYLSDHVGIVKIFNDVYRKLSIAIVIDSETKKKEISIVWDEIVKERETLVNLQGPDLNDYLQVILDDLETGEYIKMVEDVSAPPQQLSRFTIIKDKPTYRDILMDANFDLLVFAIRASKSQENPNKAKLANHFLGNLWRLYAGRKKREEIESELEEWKTAAFGEIHAGRCPQEISEGPITIDRVSNKIEDIKERYRSAQKSSQSKTNLLKIESLFVRWGDWNEAADILKRTYPDSFSKYKSRYDGRLHEVLTFAPKNLP